MINSQLIPQVSRIARGPLTHMETARTDKGKTASLKIYKHVLLVLLLTHTEIVTKQFTTCVDT